MASLAVDVDDISRLRDLNLEGLLERNKLHLVLDLDNTLVHSIKFPSNKNKRNNVEKRVTHNKKSKKTKNRSAKNNNDGDDDGDDIYEILSGETMVKLRPGARDFLAKASQLFDLSIYTMANKLYAKKIAKLLKTDKVRFLRVISGDECTTMYTKGLDIVLSHQRTILIVDDLDDVWREEDRLNLIKIKPYTFFHIGGSSSGGSGDQEFARVFGVLKDVHTKFYDEKEGNEHADKDVRQLLKEVMNGDGRFKV